MEGWSVNGLTVARKSGPSMVARRALFDVLSANGPSGVTRVSAPAGSGKTVLLRSWLDEAGLRDRAAWVSVNRNEQDAQRFWLSLIEHLRAAVGAEAFVERPAPGPEVDRVAGGGTLPLGGPAPRETAALWCPQEWGN